MKNTIIAIISSLVFLLSAIGPLNAQYNFITFDENNGLPDTYARGIAVDSMGTLWVGTQNGVAKWNGSSFEHVPIDDGVDMPFVNVLEVAPDGNIWIGYLSFGDELGISVIDPEGNLLMHADSVLRGEPGTWVNEIEFGPDGLVYIGIQEGMVIYDGVEWILEEPSSTGFPSAPFAILFEEVESMWFGTFFGLAHQFNDGSWEYFFSLNTGLVDDNIRTMEFGPDGNLWIGTDDGLSIFDGQNFENYIMNNGLPSNFIRDIAFDEMGRTWLTTDDGFSIFDGTGFQNFETYEHQFIENQIEDVLIHPTLGTWLCTREGAVKVEMGTTPVFEVPQDWIEEVKVFPVPAIDHVNIRWENDEMGKMKSVNLMDAHGRRIRKIIFDDYRNDLTIDLSAISSGTYFLSFEMEGGYFSKRIIRL